MKQVLSETRTQLHFYFIQINRSLKISSRLVLVNSVLCLVSWDNCLVTPLLMTTHVCLVTSRPWFPWHYIHIALEKHSSSLTCVFVSQLDEALWDVPSPVETDHLCFHIAACSLKGATIRVILRELHTVSGDSEPNTSVNQFWKSFGTKLFNKINKIFMAVNQWKILKQLDTLY